MDRNLLARKPNTGEKRSWPRGLTETTKPYWLSSLLEGSSGKSWVAIQ